MNKLLNKMGYVSVEVVVVASIILVGGTIGIAKYTSKEKETTNKTTTTVAKVYKDYGSDTTTPNGSGTNGGNGGGGGTTSRPEGTYLNTVKVRYEDEYGEYSNYFTVKEEYLKPNETFSWSSDELNWNDEEKKMYQSPNGISYTSPSEDKETKIDIKRELVRLDINGGLTTVNSKKMDIEDWGTFDIYINDVKIGTNVYDWCTTFRYGSKYKITNIKSKNGYAFVKEVNEGKLEGTLYNQYGWTERIDNAKYGFEIYLVFKET